MSRPDSLWTHDNVAHWLPKIARNIVGSCWDDWEKCDDQYDQDGWDDQDDQDDWDNWVDRDDWDDRDELD